MNEALEELKRVDHLIYVSLKYTRTVDVIINILNRMIDGYSLMIDALIEFAKEKGNVSVEPESAIERAELIKRICADDGLIVDNMNLYLLLRKLLRAKHVVRENEYRRHVTMKTVVEGREEIVNIDIITNYYLFQREFIIHVKGIVDGRVEVELKEQSAEQMLVPAWMHGKKAEEPVHEEPQTTVVHRTPPKKNTIKVRPVGSPPRKRAPRPKKYKIQIPKSENSITLPYEYDPHFRKELEREKARLKAEEEKKAKKKARKARKKKAKKKVARKKVRKKVRKKTRKKTRKTTRKKVRKKVRKKTPKKTRKKVKKVRKKAKKPAKKPRRTVKRLLKRVVRKVKKKVKRK